MTLLLLTKIEDLTDNRVVIAGSGGELEDDGNLTFDGEKFNVGSGVTIQPHGGVSIAGITGGGDLTVSGKIMMNSLVQVSCICKTFAMLLNAGNLGTTSDTMVTGTLIGMEFQSNHMVEFQLLVLLLLVET